MPLCVYVPLFPKSHDELPDYPDVTPQDLRDLGADLSSRLARTANMAERLAAAGWTMYAECCCLVLRPPEELTRLEIEGRLRVLGISMRGLLIEDDKEPIVPGDPDSVWAANLG
jgi:hypothetical protein